MVKAAGHLEPFNGGFCSLRVNQAVFTGNWLLDRFASIQTVVFVTSPFDFEGCSTNPAAVFDRTAADDFVFGHASKWSFYMRYFDPGSMLRNVLHVGAMRKAGHFNSLIFTKYGDGPVDTPSSRPTLMYGRVAPLDPACFTALASMAHRVKSEGKNLVVVGVPLHPQWKELYDRDGTIRARLKNDIVAAVELSGGIYWDSDADLVMSSEEFLDAIHVRWSATERLSKKLAELVGPSLLGNAARTAPGH